MNDIDKTPENDKLVMAMNGHDDADHLIALDELSRDLERRMNSAINDRQVQYRILQRIRADRDELREDNRRLRQHVADLERALSKTRLTTPPAVPPVTVV